MKKKKSAKGRETDEEPRIPDSPASPESPAGPPQEPPAREQPRIKTREAVSTKEGGAGAGRAENGGGCAIPWGADEAAANQNEGVHCT